MRRAYFSCITVLSRFATNSKGSLGDDATVPQQHEAVDFMNLALQFLDKSEDGR